MYHDLLRSTGVDQLTHQETQIVAGDVESGSDALPSSVSPRVSSSSR